MGSRHLLYSSVAGHGARLRDPYTTGVRRERLDVMSVDISLGHNCVVEQLESLCLH